MLTLRNEDLNKQITEKNYQNVKLDHEVKHLSRLNIEKDQYIEKLSQIIVDLRETPNIPNDDPKITKESSRISKLQ